MQHYCSKPRLYANPTCPASLVSISPSLLISVKPQGS